MDWSKTTLRQFFFILLLLSCIFKYDVILLLGVLNVHGLLLVTNLSFEAVETTIILRAIKSVYKGNRSIETELLNFE